MPVKRAIVLALLAALLTLLPAQHPTCDGSRYLAEVFPVVDITNAVAYGQNTTIGGITRTLRMDIYQPSGDVAAARPTIVFVHGGGFVSGNRGDMALLCELFARRGYVTATIDYRLIDAAVADSLDVGDAVVKAMGDLKAAIRFLREDAATANLYRIDADYIFSGGVSAGGVTASHAAFLDSTDAVPSYIQTIIANNGGLEGNTSSNTQYHSAVIGVLNYSGSLTRAHWIDAQSPPFYSAHDDMDPVVPYGYGSTTAFPFPVYSYGSAEIKVAGDAAGVVNELFTVANSFGHVSYFLSSNAPIVLNESFTFLNNILCGVSTGIGNPLSQNIAPALRVVLYPNPANAEINLTIANPTAPYTVNIFNVLGARVFSGRGEGRRYRVNAADLASGIYFVRVASTDAPGGATTRKFYLQK